MVDEKKTWDHETIVKLGPKELEKFIPLLKRLGKRFVAREFSVEDYRVTLDADVDETRELLSQI